MMENYIPNQKEIEKIRQEIREKKNDPILAYYFYRKISFFISSKILVKFPITANQITVFNFFLGILAGIFILLAKYPYLIFAGVLIQLVIIFDGVDGEIAKMKKCQSKFGEWLDSNLDMAKFILIYIALGFALYRQIQGILPFVLLSILMATRFMSNFMTFSVERIFSGLIYDVVDVSGLISRLSKILKLRPEHFTFSDDIKFCLISLGVLFNQLLITILILCFGQLAVLLIGFYGILKNKELMK